MNNKKVSGKIVNPFKKGNMINETLGSWKDLYIKRKHM